ncbi:MAG: hypothetical protein IBJ11_00670 [Phycisphaerales bacterium]|nr:hypothetical protein [Phycisphaerales bacterium]
MKFGPRPTDAGRMGGEINGAVVGLVLTAGLAAAAVLAVMYVLARHVGWDSELVRLKIETARLRDEYARRLAALRAGVELPLAPVEIMPEGTLADDESKAAA